MTLPTHYLITPAVAEEEEFFAALERTLQAGTRLLQLKGKGLNGAAYAELAERVLALARRYGARVLLSGDPELVITLGADGLHLDSKALQQADSRPLPARYLLAVSGHDLPTLQKGEQIGASFAVLSPVNFTRAHPDLEPLGWEGFAAISAQFSLPLYALGGVSAEDEAAAIAAGAQGVAGSRGYWKG